MFRAGICYVEELANIYEVLKYILDRQVLLDRTVDAKGMRKDSKESWSILKMTTNRNEQRKIGWAE